MPPTAAPHPSRCPTHPTTHTHPQPEGEGCYTWADGSTYEGAWHAGLKHGWGTYRWPNGAWYCGEWRDGFMQVRRLLVRLLVFVRCLGGCVQLLAQDAAHGTCRVVGIWYGYGRLNH